MSCIVEATQPKLMMSGKMYRFRPNPLVLNPHFLSNFIRSGDTQMRIDAMKTGINDSGLNLTHSRFGKLQIVIPPLNEQNRIVEKVEELFTEIDMGVKSLRAAKSTLDLYRKSLLKAAFEGRLTADWRAKNPDKLEDPETLLTRIRKERELDYNATLTNWKQAVETWNKHGEKGKKPSKPRMPRVISFVGKSTTVTGWATLPLGLLVSDPIYGTSKKCSYDSVGKGVLRIPNLSTIRIDQSDLKYADFNEAEIEKYSLIKGDILTIRSNGSLSVVGRSAIVLDQDTNFLFAGYLIRLRPIAASLVPMNLVYMMMESSIREQIENKAKSTSGVNNISAKELQELLVPICSLGEQAEIVRLVNMGFKFADTLQAELDVALGKAETLRQSVLKRAFSGKLVPQDPNDEPAAVLLERINADNALKPRKPVRRERKAAHQ